VTESGGSASEGGVGVSVASAGSLTAGAVYVTGLSAPSGGLTDQLHTKTG